MPYASDTDVPSYVPKPKRAQWRAVWNSAHTAALNEGKGKDAAEASAFAQANGVAGPSSHKKIVYVPAVELLDEGDTWEGMVPEKEFSMSFYKFLPITKIDAQNRTVTGLITSETPDRTNEICDYESSKPHYQQWSQEFSKATGGVSLGNLREMHGLKAVGKFTDINFNDPNKTVTGTAKVVDDDAWNKCAEGVYTGFSHGGEYVGPMKKEGKFKRYTARPSEVSLVDNPCNPDARFEFIRADGTSEMRKFALSATPVEEASTQVEEDEATLEKQGAQVLMPGGVGVKVKPCKHCGKNKDECKCEKAEGGYCEHCGDEKQACKCEKAHGSFCPHCGRKKTACKCKTAAAEGEKPRLEDKEEEICPHCKEAKCKCDVQKSADDETSKKPYGDVTYADPGHQSDKKKRYPVDTEAHIRAAWNYIHQGKNASQYSPEHLASVKSKIQSAWKSKIDPDGPPSAEKVAFSVTKILADTLQKRYSLSLDQVDRVFSGSMEKGMNELSRMAQLLLDSAWLQFAVSQEQDSEGDKDSTLPKQLADNISSMADTLVDMAKEETDELVAGLKDSSPPEFSMSMVNSAVSLFRAMDVNEGDGLFKAMDDDGLDDFVFKASGYPDVDPNYDDLYGGYEHTQPCICLCAACRAGDCANCKGVELQAARDEGLVVAPPVTSVFASPPN